MTQAQSDYEWMTLATTSGIKTTTPVTAEIKHEMKTLQPEYDWMKVMPVKNSKPLNDDQQQVIKMAFEVEKANNTADLWKGRHKEIENKFYNYMGDYRKLENDFLNATSENRRLQHTEQMNVLLMKQNLELREQLAK